MKFLTEAVQPQDWLGVLVNLYCLEIIIYYYQLIFLLICEIWNDVSKTILGV